MNCRAGYLYDKSQATLLHKKYTVSQNHPPIHESTFSRLVRSFAVLCLFALALLTHHLVAQDL